VGLTGHSERQQGDVELVVLLDNDGQPCGTAPKAQVHHRETPLHLAFSCWVVDDHGRVLLTQRATSKRTWPGVWTNAFCGHPAPGEPVEAAVHRRAAAELGTRITEPASLLPDFRYRAVMSDGTVENEVCPVFVAQLRSDLRPSPAEVAAIEWLAYADLTAAVGASSRTFSPWMRMQLDALVRADWAPEDL
jgi:isopentenyl-diphosphate delta-isomerase